MTDVCVHSSPKTGLNMFINSLLFFFSCHDIYKAHSGSMSGMLQYKPYIQLCLNHKINILNNIKQF